MPEFQVDDGRRQNAVGKVAEELRRALDSLAAKSPKERAEVGGVVGVREDQELPCLAVEHPPGEGIEGLSAGVQARLPVNAYSNLALSRLRRSLITKVVRCPGTELGEELRHPLERVVELPHRKPNVLVRRNSTAEQKFWIERLGDAVVVNREEALNKRYVYWWL